MTEGRDSHYQPWLRDGAPAPARGDAAGSLLGRGRRGLQRGTDTDAGLTSGHNGGDSGLERATFTEEAERRALSGDPPLGLDLARYEQDTRVAKGGHGATGDGVSGISRGSHHGDSNADAGNHTGNHTGNAPGSNDHVGNDYYAAVRAVSRGSSQHRSHQNADAPYDGSVPMPGDNVVSLPLTRSTASGPQARMNGGAVDGESWGELAAKGGHKALSGLKNGWSRFANWTIDLGQRADVPTKVAALKLDEKAKAAAAKTAALSKVAAHKTAEVSKAAASKTAEASRVAANRTAEISKSAAAKTAEASKNAAAKTAATASALTNESKERVGKLELGSKLGDVAGKAGVLVKQGASSVASVADATKGAVTGAVSDVAGQAMEKTSQIGLSLGRDKAADPASIPSALEQLLAEEEGLATPLDMTAGQAGTSPAMKAALSEPVKREAPALPLFAEVPETVPTQIAPKRGSAVIGQGTQGQATLFDPAFDHARVSSASTASASASPVAAPIASAGTPTPGSHKPLIIMPGESDMRDHRPVEGDATKADDDADAVVMPLPAREPSAFAKRWMETKDRLGDRWSAFQAKSSASGGASNGDEASNASSGSAAMVTGGASSGSTSSGSTSSLRAHNAGGGGAGNSTPLSSSDGGFFRNSNLYVALGTVAIGAAMYSAAGALPPRALSQEIASGSTPPLAAAGVDRADRAEIEAIVHDYILEHPEIIPQALERYQAQQMAQQIDGMRNELETPFAGAWTGAAKGDVVLVEFSDFACGYCRKSVSDVERLLKNDPKLKVVHRELPILSPESGAAAKTALAAAKQGKYRSYYLAQFALGRVTPETIEAAAKKAGLDPVATQKALLNGDIQTEIDKNMGMAQKLNFSGTPTFIVGDRILQGAVGYDELKKAVEEARAAN